MSNHSYSILRLRASQFNEITPGAPVTISDAFRGLRQENEKYCRLNFPSRVQSSEHYCLSDAYYEMFANTGEKERFFTIVVIVSI